jgi:zinc transporter ZupT
VNEEILKRLDALAAKLGVTAQYLWGVLIRQAVVEGALDAGLFVAGAAVAFWCFQRAKELIKDEEDDTAVFPIAIGFVVSVVACGFLYSSICELANPGYFALDKIMKVIK